MSLEKGYTTDREVQQPGWLSANGGFAWVKLPEREEWGGGAPGERRFSGPAVGSEAWCSELAFRLLGE